MYIEPSSKIYHYIYLLKEREFIKTNENIFKIGKTHQEGLSRFSSYPNGSQLLLHIICKNCDAIEKNIILSFKKKYIQRLEIGHEYFQGNYQDMLKDILEEVTNYENNNNNDGIKKKELTCNFDMFKYNDDAIKLK